jgi:hypothetical protein
MGWSSGVGHRAPHFTNSSRGPQLHRRKRAAARPHVCCVLWICLTPPAIITSACLTHTLQQLLCDCARGELRKLEIEYKWMDW